MRKAPFAGQPDKEHHKNFTKLLLEVANHQEPWRAFADYVELAAATMHNAIRPDPVREARYMEIVSRYTKEQASTFAAMHGAVILGLGEDLDVDFLGEVFTALELTNHWQGQVFTPMSLCRTLGEMTAPGPDDEGIVQRGYVTVLEPSCGAGAIILGFAAAMKAKGLNPHHQMHVTAIDIDRTAALMCYIQLALWHIPAVVHIGDTLDVAKYVDLESWATPAHYLGLWNIRLRMDRPVAEANDPSEEEQPQPAAASEPRSQLTLF